MMAKVGIEKKGCCVVKNSRQCPCIGYLVAEFWSKVAASYYLGHRYDRHALAMVVRGP